MKTNVCKIALMLLMGASFTLLFNSCSKDPVIPENETKNKLHEDPSKMTIRLVECHLHADWNEIQKVGGPHQNPESPARHMKRIQEITYELKTGQGWTLAEGSQNKFYVQKNGEYKNGDNFTPAPIYLMFIYYYNSKRDKVKMLGVPLADVFSTMKAYTGSVYVNDFNMFNRIYKVYIQAEAPYREHKENINLFFVKAANGAMVPLTSLGNASYTTGPGSIKRFNMFTTAVILGSAAQGYSSGQAMEIMEQIAREHLPDNIGVEWSGLSYQEKKAGGQTGLVLTLVFLFVFLFLAAQYESWTVPIAVLLSLPVAALGAYLGVAVCGLENDIYFQIGLVMLVGLAAKNAILIVEFAKVQVDNGGDLVQSAIHAAQLRFRPILMTSLAFVLGMLPMVLASGPGSASRQAIGTGVFFGMIFAIVFGIVLVPFFFVLIYKAKEKVQHKIKKD